MTMSPGSKSGTRPSITASVALPAWTRMTILRGFASDCDEFLQRLGADDAAGRVGILRDELVRLFRRAVVNRNLEAVVGDVEREVLTHHGEADESDIGMRFCHNETHQ